jgi:acyl-CoA synthetase (AMP-forming)/AMP-acid ligase II
VRRWKKQFPNHAYDNNYGLSEGMGPGSIHLGVENFEHLETNGVPGWGWEAEIRREDDSVVEPGSPDVGELCLRGNCVMVEYYNNPEATAESLRDGWLYTGDVAKIDADGFITLVDRAKDVIITGGENLYPVQIETFIRKHDAVKDVAVIGVADDRLGEIACAIIELKEGRECSEQEMADFCLDMPRYKRPRKYIFAEVPRNNTGKIDKPALRERYGAAHLIAEEASK